MDKVTNERLMLRTGTQILRLDWLSTMFTSLNECHKGRKWVGIFTVGRPVAA